jgi:hypothetical protein
MENKFIPGQRVVRDVDLNEFVALGTNHDTVPSYKYAGRDFPSPDRGEVYHVQDYVGKFHGEPMITLRETGDTQYLEKLFKPAKRERLKAERIRPNPYFSR